MARSEKHEAHTGSYHMNLRGVACALAGGALWGFSGTAVSYLFRSSGIDPMWVMSVRMVLAGILFLLFSVARGDRRPFELLRDKSAVRDLLLFAGAGLFLNQFSYLMAIQATNSATATVLQSLQLLPVAAVACVIGRRAPKRREVIGMVLALAGTFLITTGGDPSQMALPPAGLAFGLLAALGGAGLAVFPGKILSTYGVSAVNGWAMLLVGLIAAPFVPDWGAGRRLVRHLVLGGLRRACGLGHLVLVPFLYAGCARDRIAQDCDALHGRTHFRHGVERTVDRRRVLADRPVGLRDDHHHDAARRVGRVSRLLGVPGCLVPPIKLGDVVADVLTALVEAFELALGKIECVDLLDALSADHARQ